MKLPVVPFFGAGVAFFFACVHVTQSQSALQCASCHSDEVSRWAGSRHANTQSDLAGELAQSHPGETAASVVAGEDCIACHSPTAIVPNGGMSEAQALGYFFTTSNGVFTADTSATGTGAWPHVDCQSCHNTVDPNEFTPSLFDSRIGHYVPMSSASQLCGQCHGSLRFGDTDHRIYDAWAASRHNLTQADVAGELAASHPGETPAEVIRGENCVACHSPTAVRVSGGDEIAALSRFFTTVSGQFTADTVATNASRWPGVACTACHNPHDPGTPSYFNSTTQQYESMTNSAQLCGQCHGNLRFPDTDHLSYNIITGTGGIGVPDQQDMPGVTCTDCHMFRSDVDGSASKMFHGHSWAITVQEPDGGTTTSCAACHTLMDTAAANGIIDSWKAEFADLDAVASANVARAMAAVQGVQDANLAAALTEAQANLAYAESDESHGVHNHKYLMALLNDANAKALSFPILNAAASQNGTVVISWTGAGTLQSAISLLGPWSDVSNVLTNRVVIPPTGVTGQQYYRLRP